MRAARVIRDVARAFQQRTTSPPAAFSAADLARAVRIAATGATPSAEQIAADVAAIGSDLAAIEAFAARAHEEVAAQSHAKCIPDHSQNGEFRMLLRGLVAAGTNNGIVVDVGANGRRGSNSYDLLTDFGWKGLLIEANPLLEPRIRAEFAGTDFSLLVCAVDTQAGRQTLHFGIDDEVSSLRTDFVLMWGERTGGIEVEVKRLPEILTGQGIPEDFDLLSLDIEGMDARVLNDLIATSHYRPRWIIVEIPLSFLDLTTSGLSSEVLSLYEVVDRTLPNVILRRR